MNASPDSSPSVTVVLIFLNGEKFIREAIHSVIAQTFDAWELMVVDDGSTDGSTRIAREFAAERPATIRYLEHPGHENRGTSASRNLGVRSGRGKYIALIDSDDVWHPEKLARQVEILECQPEAAMVYNATMRWFGWTGNPEDAAKDKLHPLGVNPGRLVYPPEMIPLFLSNRGQTPATCSCLVKREALESVGAFEESIRLLYEDQAFFYKFFLRHVAFVQPGHWDWYRQHPDSCCHVHAGGDDLTSLHPAHGRFLDWFYQYLQTTGMHDPSINRALARARRPFQQPRRFRAEQALAAIHHRTGAALRRAAKRILPIAVYQRLKAIRDVRTKAGQPRLS